MIIHFLKSTLLLISITLLFSCNTEELENKITALENEKVVAENTLIEREELLMTFVSSMNEIEENLSKIKEQEKIITTQFNHGNIELNNSTKDQILDDIDLINNLIKDNKTKMASLNAKLGKSNLKITELEKMMESLAGRIQEKDAEIQVLQSQLAETNTQLKVLFQEYNNRLEEIGNQEDELNTAYYCYGSSKELKERKIISKEGGFIGIGKTERLAKNFDINYFTKIDISQINEIELMSKKAKVITNHPPNSYEIKTKEGLTEKLIIKDVKAFWSVSKYLVILVE